MLPTILCFPILIFSQSLTCYSQTTNDTFVHLTHYCFSFALCPSLYLNSLGILNFFSTFLPISVPLSISLSSSIVCSLCYSSHLCSVYQHSDPSSYNQTLQHLTYPLAGQEPSVHPVLCFSVLAWGLPSACVKMRECEVWNVCSGGSQKWQ